MSEKLKIVYRPLKELTPYARTHSDEQAAQLVASIEEFGWTNPVLVDENGEIITDHGRVLAAEAISIVSFPTITLTGLTEEQKRAYRLADNRLPLNAGWDSDLLKLEVTDLLDADFNLSLTDFTQQDIDDLLVVIETPASDDDPYTTKIDSPVYKEAAVNAHKALNFKAEGKQRLGFDVADSGSDKCANVLAEGSVAMWGDEWKAAEDELMKGCKRTYNAALKYDAEVVYDSIGVGATRGSKFKEMNEDRKQADRKARQIEYHKFNVGEGVFQADKFYQPGIRNKDFFSNLKAQAWWLQADRFSNTYNAIKNGEKYAVEDLISIDGDFPLLEQLKDELSTPRRDFDKNGMVKVESKEDLADRDIPSPNIADAFVMAFAPVKSRRGIFG